MSSPLARLTAALLGVLLAACGSTRHLAPAHAGELTRFVLFIRELPDGTVTHSWQRAEEVNLSKYRVLARSRGMGRRIQPVVARPRDCDEENRECVRKCMTRPLPRGYGHITSGNRGRGGKAEYCAEECRQPYTDCLELQELQARESTTVDSAVDWLKRNREAMWVGSVVVAGVVFVVLSAGAGLLVLAPAVLLAEPETPTEPRMAEVAP